jgi:hypothetical protein
MRMKNKKIFVLMLAATLLLTPVTAFAGGKTVNVNGYEDVGMDQLSLSVSNVTKELDVKTLEAEMDAYFEVQAPSVVTTLNDSARFDVYKMNPVDGQIFTSGTKIKDVKGQAKIWVPDPLDVTGVYLKTVEISELENIEHDIPLIVKGANATLTEPGYYYVVLAYEALAGSADVLIHVTGSGTAPAADQAAPAKSDVPAKADAKPTASKVLVNSAATSFEAYNINGNNYFKLRDIAKVVSGTEKQFDVEYNASVKAINLLPGKAYTAVGGEMAAGDGKAKSAVLNTSKIYKDGQEVALTAYNINGNNYFKLRDLASAFNIGVTWDGATNTVGIDTALEYTE